MSSLQQSALTFYDCDGDICHEPAAKGQGAVDRLVLRLPARGVGLPEAGVVHSVRLQPKLGGLDVHPQVHLRMSNTPEPGLQSLTKSQRRSPPKAQAAAASCEVVPRRRLT